jgi:hypothetical protein
MELDVRTNYVQGKQSSSGEKQEKTEGKEGRWGYI